MSSFSIKCGKTLSPIDRKTEVFQKKRRNLLKKAISEDGSAC